MDPITTSYITGIVTNLSTNLLQALGRRVRDKLIQPAGNQAFQHCIHTAIVAVLQSLSHQDKNTVYLLKEICEKFFTDPDVSKELVELLKGRKPDHEELRYFFEQSGFDPKTLPQIQFEQVIDLFEGGFLIAASEEPLLQPIIQTHQLLLQSELQSEILFNIKELVKMLRESSPDSIEISSGKVRGRNTKTQSILEHQMVVHIENINLTTENKHREKYNEALRTAYLNHLYEQTKGLSFSGLDLNGGKDIHGSPNVVEVYTPLYTLSSEESDIKSFGIEFNNESRQRSALEVLNRHKRMILLGDPGSGKSTFVNFVVLCITGEILGQEDTNIKVLTTPLPLGSGEIHVHKDNKFQSWSHGPLIPVRIILRDFAASGLLKRGEEPTANHLWKFICKELSSANLSDYSEFLRQELIESGGLLLLDGLDEVPDLENRRSQIKDTIKKFISVFRNCRVLITSRTYAYQRRKWKLGDFSESTLAPLNEGQILYFIEKWYRYYGKLRFLKVDDCIGRMSLFKTAIFNNDRLRSLAKKPILLSLMASLHARYGGSLPEKRVELYEIVVDLLLDRWEKPKIVRNKRGIPVIQQPSLTEWLKVDRQKVRDLLNELAFQAQQGYTKEVEIGDIAQEELICGLMAITSDPEQNPAQLVEYLTSRAGILEPHGENHYRFPHRTFQEYLSACYLTDNDYPEKIAELVIKAPNRWREVALLAAAKAARGASCTVWQIIEHLCYEDFSTDQISKEHCWGIHIAGLIALESARLENISKLNQQKLDRLKKCLLPVIQNIHFPVFERNKAGNTLMKLGDPRREILSLSSIKFCWIPPGPFWQGSDEYGENEMPLHLNDLLVYPFGLSQFPISNGQFNEFVQAGGYSEEKFWEEAKKANLWTKYGIKGLFDQSYRQHPQIYESPFNELNHPVVGLTWYESLAFTRWITELWQKEGKISEEWNVLLPSEAEWEKGARGGITLPQSAMILAIPEIVAKETTFEEKENFHSKSRFPWGDEPEANRANYRNSGIGTTNVLGIFRNGMSPYNCEEMSGNVWEWTRSLWGKQRSAPNFFYPYDPFDGREDMQVGREILRVLRGGSFPSSDQSIRYSSRYGNYPDGSRNFIGFRIVLSRKRQNS